jgi:hypothetical protein
MTATLTDKELADRRHLEWCKALLPGDRILDPRYRHLRIRHIEDHYSTPIPAMVLNIIYTWPIPLNVCSKLHDIAEWVCDKLGMTEMWDRTITFEDGQEVSAYELVNFPEHKEN